jgi:SOS-response transcriptional repressor LexA
MISKYERVRLDLEKTGEGKMKCFGGSMTPIFPSSGCTMYYKKQDSYEVGDIVFCKVKGRYIDAHLITRKSEQGYLISNNHGHDNGWTRQIFGRVVKAEIGSNVKEFK